MIRRPDINYRWPIWDGWREPDVNRARIEADRLRARRLQVVTRTIPIALIEDPSVRVRFIGHPNRLRDPFRRWSELEFSGQPIYLEMVGGNGTIPGFGVSLVRIYLDCEMVGCAPGGGQALVFDGPAGPAVAMLRDDLALRVDRKAENLELVRETEPGTKAALYRERPRRAPRRAATPKVRTADEESVLAVVRRSHGAAWTEAHEELILAQARAIGDL